MTEHQEPDFTDRMRDNGFGKYDFRDEKMDAFDSYLLGLSLADVYRSEAESNSILVGRDHRAHSRFIKDGVVEGLLEGGLEVEDAGPMTTAGLAYSVSENDFAGGVEVTASHMPVGVHGLKPLRENGVIFGQERLDETLEGFEAYVKEKEYRDDFRHSEEDFLGKYFNEYLKAVVSCYDELFENDLSGTSVVVDSGNGMGSLTLPPVLESLGAEVYEVNEVLDPRFPGRPGADPTNSDLSGLKQKVRDENADIGIGLDGDADRAVYVDERGQIVDGSEALAVLAGKLAEENNTDGLGAVSCSVDTSPVIEDHAREIGSQVIRQPKGAVFPAEHAMENERVVIGGQPNGHYIYPDFALYDSGTLFGVLMPGLIKEADSKLSELTGDLPEYDVGKVNYETENPDNAIIDLKKMFGLSEDYEGFNGVHRTKVSSAEIRDYNVKPDWLGNIQHDVHVTFWRSGSEEGIVRIVLEQKSSDQVLSEIEQSLDGQGF